jgi:PAS domain S-box-containing protein
MSVTRATSSDNIAPPVRWFDGDERAHVVQFYNDDDVLLDTLSHYVGSALSTGGAAIVIATASHREGLEERLRTSDPGFAIARKDSRYVALDAAETVAQLMVGGLPDAQRFENLIGGLIAQVEARVGRRKRVAAFGEMVALLCASGNAEAAVRLEKLWNALSKTHSFALRCAYPLKGFGNDTDGKLFLKVCGEHSAVIPGEEYSLLDGDNERLVNVAQLQQKAHALEAENALRVVEEKFHLLVESVQDYAIFMLDTQGHVSSWNVGAERIKGYRASEIIGRHFSCFYPEKDIRAGKPQMELEVASREGRFEDEGWRLRRDGSLFWANVIITALRDRSGQLCGFSKVTRDMTERMRAHEALKEANAELRREIAQKTVAERRLHESEASLRKLSAHLFRMQDEEQRRLGRELHDGIGQYLAALKMGLDSLRSAKSVTSAEYDRLAGECSRLVQQSLKEVRTISYLLHPPMLEEMGLASAIPWYLEGFTKRSGIQTTFEISSGFERLPGDIELAIFRILQEGLTNVLRHSESPTAEVRLVLDGGKIVLEIKDAGKGMPTQILESSPDAPRTDGVGLRGIRERVRQFGGNIEFPPVEKGTALRATIPVQTLDA